MPRSRILSQRFNDRVVLVTGATSGIGEACANLFADRGASVLLTGRDQAKGDAMCAALLARGSKAAFLAGDVRDSAFCDAAVAAAVAEFGRIDVLINSAGIWRAASTVDTTDELWHATIETNISGTFFMARAALRRMLEQGSGNIVNIASDWGLLGGQEAAAYCASKGAVVLLTKAMALDHARDNIRINVLCPTDTDTPMMDNDYIARGMDLAEGKASSSAANPMGRMATANDVAEAACFLASSAAGFITGVSLPIDGGATAD